MPYRVFLDIIKDKRSKCVQTKKIPAVSPKRRPRGNTPVGVDGFEPPTLCL